jgi:dephospho-CoA kinase
MSYVDGAMRGSTPRRRIPIIGIVGGIGSGKTAVANWVAEHANVTVLNADELGHAALQSDFVKKELCERFGSSILDTEGNIERMAIARQVFGADVAHLEARRDLERIVHPEIARRIAEGVEIAVNNQHEAVLLDAAILLEAGWRTKCDLVVFIDTPDAIRLDRVKQSRNWSAEELKRREQSQWTLMEKRRESDLIVSNDGEVERAGQKLLEALTQRGLINHGQALVLTAPQEK